MRFQTTSWPVLICLMVLRRLARMLSYNKLESVELPGSVISIGAYAFSDNQLASVDLPDGLEAIGEDAFRITN